MGGLRRPAGVLVGAAMLIQTACYSYVPVAAGAAPVVGDYVKVRLTPDGSAAMAQFLGPRVEWAEGTMSDRLPDGSVVVGVEQVRLVDGTVHFWTGRGVVTIAPSQLAEVQRRALDRGRTRTVSVLLAVGLVGIAALALGTGGAHGQPEGGVTLPPP